MTKALYRKYRPKILDEVVGESQIVTNLKNSLKAGKISHAYLFTGPRGTGKTSVARIFAHEINGFKYELEDSYLDIIEIDAASNTGVDNIRELREKAAIAPSEGKYKVYIIDEIHMLSKSAFNALLKTLEEPPEHVVFIMATTNPEKVPITITSRSQVYTFHLADVSAMAQHLRAVSDKEGIKINDSALTLIARRGGGSFRDSLSLLDQISTLSETEITAELVESALGLPADESISQLLRFYENNDFSGISSQLKDLANSGTRPEIIAAEIISRITNDPQPQFIKLLSSLTTVAEPFADAKLLLAFAPNSTASQPAPIAPASPKVAEVSSAPKTPDTPVAKPIPALSAPSDGNFSWETFLEEIHSENVAIYNQLTKVTYTISGSTLELFPVKSIVKTILERKNNREIISAHLHGMDLTIHDVGAGKKDPTISQISDIMGAIQEVKNGGEIPF